MEMGRRLGGPKCKNEMTILAAKRNNVLRFGRQVGNGFVDDM